MAQTVSMIAVQDNNCGFPDTLILRILSAKFQGLPKDIGTKATLAGMEIRRPPLIPSEYS
jgi:hypothetical protein